MDEVAELLRELIDEVRELKSEIALIRGPLGYDLTDLHGQLVQINDNTGIGGELSHAVTTLSSDLTGPLGYTLSDIHEAIVER